MTSNLPTLDEAGEELTSDGQGRPRVEPQVFHPMSLVENTIPDAVPEPTPRQRFDAGFSPHYRGNIEVEANRSADIPDSENCSLFITGLPPDTTVNQLLAQIRGMGRVYATHINPPETKPSGHKTCAAKVVFFETAVAQRFYALYNPTGLLVGGQRAHVALNRIKSAQPSAPPYVTRVLRVKGPERLVNVNYMLDFFRSKIVFQMDEIITHPRAAGGGRATLEFRFGSYRVQAQSMRTALVREHPEVRVRFEVDPCALGEPV